MYKCVNTCNIHYYKNKFFKLSNLSDQSFFINGHVHFNEISSKVEWYVYLMINEFY
jgi:hypothetical protein